jgi:hypothetical protein
MQGDTSSATTHSSILLSVFLELFLRKSRGLKQSFATDAPHHLAYQRSFPLNLSWLLSEGGFSLLFWINREFNRVFQNVHLSVVSK